MASTNAYICDRCGKVAKKTEHWQIRVLHKSWPDAISRKPIDLCGSCYKEFKEFIDPYEKSVPFVWHVSKKG